MIAPVAAEILKSVLFEPERLYVMLLDTSSSTAEASNTVVPTATFSPTYTLYGVPRKLGESF